MDKNKQVVYEEGGRHFATDDSGDKESQKVTAEVGD
jgi:hypothetical protein